VRLCLVSPYPWDRPNEANDHIGALARALAERGHEVVVLAAAGKPALLLEGRRRFRALERGDATALKPVGGEPLIVAVGPAAGNLPVPVAVAANVREALAYGRFDVVDVFDPDLPGASAIALRESASPAIATFLRIGPPLKTPRGAERLAARADAVAASSPAVAARVLERFGLPATVTGPAVDGERFAPSPAAAPPLVTVEARLAPAAHSRALTAEVTAARGEIVRIRAGSTPPQRAAALRGASVFLAAEHGSPLIGAEAAASGIAIVAPAGSPASDLVEHERTGLVADPGEPAIAAAMVGRLLADADLRARLGAAAAEAAPDARQVAERVEALYAAHRPTRAPRPVPPEPDDLILADFHMHTDRSHDCATPPEEVVQRAVAMGLGAIAVTDHNTIAGGLAARAYAAAQGLDLHVIVGSEVKTATGEVIGLYLEEEIPRGMLFADTVEAIRAQGAVVYVPHPFDRLHAIPDPVLLARLADQIDVLEIYNARLYRESFNREAERFADRHDLLRGAGSDAHVGEGIGTGAIELPRFSDPASLLVSLGAGRVVRRPANLLYLQGLKWIRQARRPSRRGEG
jgi:predicted metal-dependent phosphoesterase TrpH